MVRKNTLGKRSFQAQTASSNMTTLVSQLWAVTWVLFELAISQQSDHKSSAEFAAEFFTNLLFHVLKDEIFF